MPYSYIYEYKKKTIFLSWYGIIDHRIPSVNLQAELQRYRQSDLASEQHVRFRFNVFLHTRQTRYGLRTEWSYFWGIAVLARPPAWSGFPSELKQEGSFIWRSRILYKKTAPFRSDPPLFLNLKEVCSIILCLPFLLLLLLPQLLGIDAISPTLAQFSWKEGFR